MRIKIICKTPDTEIFPGLGYALSGQSVEVVNADTGEPIEGYTHLSLNLDQNSIITATMQFEPAAVDIETIAEVRKN